MRGSREQRWAPWRLRGRRSRRGGQPSPCTARRTGPARRPFGPAERECGVSRVRVPGLGSPPASSALGLRSSSFPRPLLAVSGGVAEAPHFRSPLHPWLPLIRAQWDPLLGSLVRMFSEGPGGRFALSLLESSRLLSFSAFPLLPSLFLMQVDTGYPLSDSPSG